MERELAYSALFGSGYIGAKLLEGSSEIDLNSFVILDGSKSDRYQTVLEDPVFSQEGNHIAYFVQKNFKELLVKDGVEESLGKWEVEPGTQAIFYSPNGKKLAYIANNGARPVFNKYDQYEEFLVMNGKKVRPNLSPINMLYSIGDVYFSKNSQHFFYFVQKNTQALGKEIKNLGHILVIDGTKEMSGASMHCPVITNDGKIVFSGDEALNLPSPSQIKRFIGVDDKRIGLYDEMSCPQFVDDGKTVLFGTVIGNSVYRVEMPL